MISRWNSNEFEYISKCKGFIVVSNTVASLIQRKRRGKLAGRHSDFVPKELPMNNKQKNQSAIRKLAFPSHKQQIKEKLILSKIVKDCKY